MGRYQDMCWEKKEVAWLSTKSEEKCIRKKTWYRLYTICVSTLFVNIFVLIMADIYIKVFVIDFLM